MKFIVLWFDCERDEGVVENCGQRSFESGILSMFSDSRPAMEESVDKVSASSAVCVNSQFHLNSFLQLGLRTQCQFDLQWFE